MFELGTVGGCPLTDGKWVKRCWVSDIFFAYAHYRQKKETLILVYK